MLLVKRVRLADSGRYSCTATNAAGTHTASSRVSVVRKEKKLTTTTSPPTPATSVVSASSETTTMSTTTAAAATTSPTTTVTMTTTTTMAPVTVAESGLDESLPCPIQGYCLNGGTCSFIPWLGELTCTCAPGFQGARCDRKTTSALYSSLSMASTLCLFGIANPYHSC